MAIALKAPLTLFHRAFASLSPGGYFEMQDPSPPIRAFDSSLDGSALLRAADLLLTATKKVGSKYILFKFIFPLPKHHCSQNLATWN